MATLSNRLMVRLSAEDRQRLAARATAEDRKESDLARHLIRKGLGREAGAHA